MSHSATHGLPSQNLDPEKLHPADPASVDHQHTDNIITAQSIEHLQNTHITSPTPRPPVNTTLNDSIRQTNQQPLPSLLRQYTEDTDTPSDIRLDDKSTPQNNAFPSAVLAPQTVDKVTNQISQPHPVGADVEPSTINQNQ